MANHRICEVNAAAADLLPPKKPDGSGIGINYVDAYLKPMNVTLEGGPKVAVKRRAGLEVSLKFGDKEGAALLRIEDAGGDPQRCLANALAAAANQCGYAISVENNVIYLSEKA